MADKTTKANQGATEPTADVPFNADAQIKLDTAHDILQHPDKFAEVFVKAAGSQIQIKELIRKEIKESLESDIPTRAAMKGLIKDQFREDWKAFIISAWGKVALVVWTVIVLAIGAVLNHYLGGHS